MREKINYESIQFYISTFEESKQRLTPEIIEEMMNGATDKNFWDNENLQQSLEYDIAFAAKIWGGFHKLIEITGLAESKDWKDQYTVEEFNFLSELAMRGDLPINFEAKAAAIKKIKEIFSNIGVPPDILRGSVIMKLAYIGEAEAMEIYGIDWRKEPPFTFSIKLIPEHPLVDEVLKKEQEEKIKWLIENDPDKIFDEFYKGKKPLVQ